MSVDTISNFLTKVRNALMASKPFVLAPYTKMNHSIVQILLNEGFVREVVIVDEESLHKTIKVILKYVDGESVIHEL